MAVGVKRTIKTSAVDLFETENDYYTKKHTTRQNAKRMLINAAAKHILPGINAD